MTKNLRYLWRLLVTFVKRRKLLIFAGFALGIFAFFVLPRFFNLLPEKKQTKTIGLVGRYTLENMPESVQNLISLGLTKLEEDGNPVPGLTKEWMIGNDGKTYTFKLADNLRWHDGTPIRAKDINYNFQDVTTKVLDDKTIQFSLKEPFSAFPAVVSRPIFKKGFIGIGPYRLQKIVRQGQYIESIFLRPTDTQKADIIYKFYPTESTAKTAFKLGEVTNLEDIVDPSGFEKWKNVQITPKDQYNRYVALFFDTSKPVFKDNKTLRQALDYAIPKEQGSKRALGPISPLSWAYNSDVKPYELDLDNAKTLLSKSIDKNQQLSIKLTTASFLWPEAEKIKKGWEALGIKTEIQPITTPGEDFEALLAIQEIPSDPDEYTMWHSTQTVSNITKLNNKRIDKLLEDGRKTSDRQTRKKTYLDFQRFLVEEAPAAFLYYPTTYEISKK